MTVTNQKVRRKKDQILMSAIKIVNERGHEGATMEEIAAELQMTKGSLYYYFKNKNDLLYQCHHLVLSRAIAEHEDHLLENLSPEQLLRKMVSTHISFAINEREIFSMMIDPKRTFDDGQLESVLLLRKKYAALFDEVIRRGIASQQFERSEVVLVRMFILGAMNWVQQWFNEEGRFNQEQLIEEYADYVLKLLKK
ncbi:TetR family transcriptional regulator [Savagea sp. SN6]|uniref:TetR family transcriptional regulator n=1 Tax=Savagea serpentis TaxID=2785297 RepID=A0A8J7KEH1_9BACL|nr:TetR/AcrR family transcriptional regulator [Savagea serpentis]MBF4501146.1 TetR family transcriptional regulator [Savagea serpentis]